MSGLTASGHRTFIEEDACRAVCKQCPWFKWDPEASDTELRQYGYRHRDATKIR